MKTYALDEYTHAQIMERIYSITHAKKQIELADFLGVRQASISDAKKRRSISAEWLLTLLRKKGVSPDWVLTGKGGKFLQETEREIASSVVYVTEIRPPEECSAQELVNELVRRAVKTE